jgi:predicted dithiol-disulfide oxidoreductase (DUF899 family)
MMTAHPDTPGEWFQFAVALRATGQLIGDCAAMPRANDPSQCEIGFTIAPRHQGRGYATEAVRLLAGYLFARGCRAWASCSAGLRVVRSGTGESGAAPGSVFVMAAKSGREGEDRMKTPPMVSPEEWRAAREQLLVKEKELTRARDALAAERRRMPWLAVDREYWFEGPDGRVSLAGLFEGRRQLIVYRAFYGPEVTTYAEGGSYPERACVGCSLGADQVAHPGHLHARNTTLAFASRAPQAEIERLKGRHGWNHIPWYTITDDFDKDFDVDEWHGTNAFIREGDRVFRTYFINDRGDEQMGSTWNYLDITALGRQETQEDSPEGYRQTPPYQWWNYHDVHDAAK